MLNSSFYILYFYNEKTIENLLYCNTPLRIWTLRNFPRTSQHQNSATSGSHSASDTFFVNMNTTYYYLNRCAPPPFRFGGDNFLKTSEESMFNDFFKFMSFHLMFHWEKIHIKVSLSIIDKNYSTESVFANVHKIN